MSHMLCLRPDDITETRIVNFQAVLHDKGIDPVPHWARPAPMLLLAAVDDVAKVGRLMKCVAAAWEPLSATFCQVGIQPGLSPAIALLACPSLHLLMLHQRLYTMVPTIVDAEGYMPDRWVPRIVVTEEVNSIADAVRTLLPMLDRPIRSKLVSLELVDRTSGLSVESYPLSYR